MKKQRRALYFETALRAVSTNQEFINFGPQILRSYLLH